MDIERSLKPVKEISMIPLINVVFLLLIFFLVAGTLEKFDVLKVEPPVAKSGETLDQGPIVLILGKHQEILLNDELLREDQVIPQIEQILEIHPGRQITIKADANLKAYHLIRMFDRIQAAGGHHITIATEAL